MKPIALARLARLAAPFPRRRTADADAHASRPPASLARAAPLVAIALGAALAMPLAAQTVAPAAVDARPAMSFQQLAEHLGGQGYRDMEEIERKSDKLFEVKVREADGTRVELLLDARSGEILKREVKRDKRR